MYRLPHGFECKLEKKVHANRLVIAQGEAKCILGLLCAIFLQFHSNPCGYLLIIRHLANNN